MSQLCSLIYFLSQKKQEVYVPFLTLVLSLRSPLFSSQAITDFVTIWLRLMINLSNGTRFKRERDISPVVYEMFFATSIWHSSLYRICTSFAGPWWLPIGALVCHRFVMTKPGLVTRVVWGYSEPLLSYRPWWLEHPWTFFSLYMIILQTKTWMLLIAHSLFSFWLLSLR